MAAAMRITPIPCLSDNYAYLVEGSRPGVAVVVDPSEAGPVVAALSARGLRLEAVLATHHHPDHVGGIDALRSLFPEVTVAAFRGDAGRIPHASALVDDGASVELCGLSFEARHIPGHTLGAVAWITGEARPDEAVFTGDTLFVAGCGRLFEGTPADLHRSLYQVLGALPDDTLVYCGHEYTEANLRFALAVEPSNPSVAQAARDAAAARAAGRPTVPSSLGSERAHNPFLRVADLAVRAFTGLPPSASDAEVLGALRAAKDTFGVGAKAGYPAR